MPLQVLDNVLNRLRSAPRVKAKERKSYRQPRLFTGASITVEATVTAEDILAVEGVEVSSTERSPSAPPADSSFASP